MSKISLDLSKFKHVKSDKDTATLQHSDGHQLTIAIKKLSPEFQEQLNALAKHSKESKDKPKQEQDHVKFKQDIQNYDHGGAVENPVVPMYPRPAVLPQEVTDMANVDPNEATPAVPPLNPYPQIYEQNYEQRRAQDPGEPEVLAQKLALNRAEIAKKKDEIRKEDQDLTNSENDTQQAEIQQRMQKIGMLTQDSSNQPQSNTTSNSAQTQAQPDQPMPNQGLDQRQPSSANPNDINDIGGQYAKGYKDVIQGIQGQAAATGLKSKEELDALTKQADAQKTAISAFNDSMDDIQREYHLHQQDVINGHIDPEGYWNGTINPRTGQKEGGHSRIAGAIGMILGGFNPSNKPNAAMEFIQSQINNNIEAQSKNLDSKNNLLAANLKMMSNMRDAADMTRLQLNDQVANGMAQAAAKSANPMAKYIAQQEVGKMEMERPMVWQKIASSQALMKMMNDPNIASGNTAPFEHMLNQMEVTDPERAAMYRNRLVPGVGIAQTKDVPQADRTKIASIKNVNDLINQALQMSKQHSGTLDPRIRAQADTLHQNLIAAIKNAQGDGVYKESEANFLLKQIGSSSVSMLSGISSVPHLKEYQRINQTEYNHTLDKYGIPHQQLQQNQEIKTYNGVQYIRGPDGKSVPLR